MTSSSDRLSNSQIAAAGLDDWRKLAQALHGRFRSADPAARAAFVSALFALPRVPDVRLTADVVDVSIATKQDGIWVTAADIDDARAVSDFARESGLTAEPEAVTQLELALDTADEARVAPFWSALLTGSPDNKIYDSVFDPTGRVPSLWFQPSEPDDEVPGQRWHFDLWLAPEVAGERIGAALDAGGRVVHDGGPSYVVLADPDGNRVCVCTSLDRD